MSETNEFPTLDGQFLIAMPGMGDPRFERSVIFVCAHSAEGAMGLIVNKPAPDLRFSDLLEQLEIPAGRDTSAIRVHIGGPVEHGRGFVLHSNEYSSPASTLRVDDRFGMTATLDILEDISQGQGPRACLLALGYAGWGPGQLEAEIQRNGWLTCDASPDIVFGLADHEKWGAALESMGISPSFLSSDGGTA
ncbi:YqgE/AlgH family protein [Maritimibacter sp. 55A14]|uniref:YqgE/AlgH family protein n=1 Tax=Maritimibacter sp. 55A14 TaxID=2174844 RepID=UPI000D60D6E6|nr:YqgE/AlgH family protein [Maritimibacter sp. 55A14]PWE32310.1 YqgE/AlgH family protein [Maritimibacter sp. 55A14]